MRPHQGSATVASELANADDWIAIPQGTLLMGSTEWYSDETPLREVAIRPFRISRAPVTNRQFARFVAATGYVTVAERPLDASIYRGISPDRLRPGALVFVPPRSSTKAEGVHDWWRYVPSACWRRPEAARSVFAGRLDHPVVCIAYEDAASYARWSGGRLPTEAEWEWAARGGLVGATYAWGDEWMPGGTAMANTWQGSFPEDDLNRKSLYRTSKIGSYPANPYGLYDMIGNVWEWTASWYRTASSGEVNGCCSPPLDSYDPDQPDILIPRRVLKGGSFLCAANYCARYRPAARQAQMIDTASVHIGFRCVFGVSADACAESGRSQISGSADSL